MLFEIKFTVVFSCVWFWGFFCFVFPLKNLQVWLLIGKVTWLIISFTLMHIYLKKEGRRFCWPDSDCRGWYAVMYVSCIHCKIKLLLILDFMNLITCFKEKSSKCTCAVQAHVKQGLCSAEYKENHKNTWSKNLQVCIIKIRSFYCMKITRIVCGSHRRWHFLQHSKDFTEPASVLMFVGK